MQGRRTFLIGPGTHVARVKCKHVRTVLVFIGPHIRIYFVQTLRQQERNQTTGNFVHVFGDEHRIWQIELSRSTWQSFTKLTERNMREFVLFTILSQSLMMTNSKDHLQQPQPNRIGGLYDITMIQWISEYFLW